jgi:hypothetical protein
MESGTPIFFNIIVLFSDRSLDATRHGFLLQPIHREIPRSLFNPHAFRSLRFGSDLSTVPLSASVRRAIRLQTRGGGFCSTSHHNGWTVERGLDSSMGSGSRRSYWCSHCKCNCLPSRHVSVYIPPHGQVLLACEYPARHFLFRYSSLLTLVIL